MMVVVPTSSHVRLHYERSKLDYVAYLLTRYEKKHHDMAKFGIDRSNGCPRSTSSPPRTTTCTAGWGSATKAKALAMQS